MAHRMDQVARNHQIGEQLGFWSTAMCETMNGAANVTRAATHQTRLVNQFDDRDIPPLSEKTGALLLVFYQHEVIVDISTQSIPQEEMVGLMID